MDPKALFSITYGLYLLTAREGTFDNGCIINTAVQVAEDPVRFAISVIKKNKTHEMIMNTGVFNLSPITTEADFALFQRFGMQSGRDADKFAGFTDVARGDNGLLYLTGMASAFLSARVVERMDLGTHTLFIAEITDGRVLSDGWGCTYAYYQADIKPKPARTAKRSWVCTVCGYVYEGDEVPEDYLCPRCNHGKEVFQLTDG
ncbi:MAG: flavin reductase [Clostridiales bacterium]|nr:flavin reductase [Clostridiales bacterium]